MLEYKTINSFSNYLIGNKCHKCKHRRYLAQVFDIHIDWQDCPLKKECKDK